MRKIAIIGKCSNTRERAPIRDNSWEKWGLAWDPLPVCHRYFEIHENWWNFKADPVEAGYHKRWMQGQVVPVYMLKKEPEIPTSVRYPMEQVADLIGRTRHGTPYLESSISYMMALALLELWDDDKPARIGIWGCDLSVDSEYAYQRPNMEYLIGLARGRGIHVFVPAENAILSPCRHVPYGFDAVPEDDPQPRPAWMPKIEEKDAA